MTTPCQGHAAQQQADVCDYRIELKITDPNTGRGLVMSGYISAVAKQAILKVLDDDFENELKVDAT